MTDKRKQLASYARAAFVAGLVAAVPMFGSQGQATLELSGQHVDPILEEAVAGSVHPASLVAAAHAQAVSAVRDRDI